MTLNRIVALCAIGLSVHCASAQTPASPAPADPPAAPPSAPPAPAVPAAAPKSNIVEGKLMRSQRSTDDRGKFSWICTYSVAGTKRNVQLDESCPAEMPFDLKR